jgi:imidazoleglycerol phosphate dehydratase HisB
LGVVLGIMWRKYLGDKWRNNNAGLGLQLRPHNTVASVCPMNEALAECVVQNAGRTAEAYEGSGELPYAK